MSTGGREMRRVEAILRDAPPERVAAVTPRFEAWFGRVRRELLEEVERRGRPGARVDSLLLEALRDQRAALGAAEPANDDEALLRSVQDEALRGLLVDLGGAPGARGVVRLSPFEERSFLYALGGADGAPVGLAAALVTLWRGLVARQGERDGVSYGTESDFEEVRLLDPAQAEGEPALLFRGTPPMIEAFRLELRARDLLA